MLYKCLFAAIFIQLCFVVACKNEQDKAKEQVAIFKTFTDSILAFNKNYVEVLYGDTQVLNIVDPSNPEIRFNDTAIALHANIFDTTAEYTKSKMHLTLAKYNALEAKIDSLVPNMDTKTRALFEQIKHDINTIKQPIK